MASIAERAGFSPWSKLKDDIMGMFRGPPPSGPLQGQGPTAPELLGLPGYDTESLLAGSAAPAMPLDGQGMTSPELLGPPGGALGLGAGIGGAAGGDPYAALFNLLNRPPRGMGHRGGYQMKPVDTAAFDKLAGELTAAQQAAAASQQQGIDTLEGHRKKVEANPLQVDMSPLLALSDTWFGGDLQKGYARPTTPEQRDAQLLEIQSALQKSRGALTAEQVDMLKARLGVEGQKMGLLERHEDRKATLAQAAAQHADTMDLKLLLAQLAKEAKGGKEGQEQRQALGKSEALKSTLGLIEYRNALKGYEDAIEKYGAGNAPLSGDARTAVSNAYNNVTITAKNAYGLGALAAADMELVEKNMPDLSSFFGGLGGMTKLGGGKKGVQAALAQLRQNLNTNYTTNRKLLGQTFPHENTRDMLQTVDQAWENVPGAAAALDRNDLIAQLLAAQGG